MAARPENLNIAFVEAQYFEDTLDGYFPLAVSCADLMRRRGFAAAWLSLAHAPILDIAELPPDAPVPLNTDAGRVGMIDQMLACVTLTEVEAEIEGTAQWHWLGEGCAPQTLSPMTRLAEPAFLRGIAITQHSVEQGNQSPHKSGSFVKLDVSNEKSVTTDAALRQLGWAAARLWGPLHDGPGIRELGSKQVLFRGRRISRDICLSIGAGRYYLQKFSQTTRISPL